MSVGKLEPPWGSRTVAHSLIPVFYTAAVSQRLGKRPHRLAEVWFPLLFLSFHFYFSLPLLVILTILLLSRSFLAIYFGWPQTTFVVQASLELTL